ncbi:sigma factor [Parasphingorhabdus pacifica]
MSSSGADALQEALIHALEIWPNDPPRDPKAWLVTVAWRRFLDAARAEASRRGRCREGRAPADPGARHGRHAAALLPVRTPDPCPRARPSP